jgi:hypothetical protein
VVNLADRLDMPWRDCKTFFLSRRVLRRTLSCKEVRMLAGVSEMGCAPRLPFASKRR